jgi:hypothetical protein
VILILVIIYLGFKSTNLYILDLFFDIFVPETYINFSVKRLGVSQIIMFFLAGYVFSSSPFFGTFSIVFYHSKSVFMFCLVSLLSTGLNRSGKGSSQQRRERRG